MLKSEPRALPRRPPEPDENAKTMTVFVCFRAEKEGDHMKQKRLQNRLF